MGFIKFVLWTVLAVGLGIFLASYPIAGKTPMGHAQRLWQQGLQAVSSERQFRERHSAEDRDEVARLISKRSTAR